MIPNNVLAYYGNRVSINDQDVPMNFRVDTTERTVAPPFRGGALVVFPVARLQILTGTVSVHRADGVHVPAYGQLTLSVNNQTVDSPIGKKGEFYLENVPVGAHDALIEDEDRHCRFVFVVPDSPDPILKLGEVLCEDGGQVIK